MYKNFKKIFASATAVAVVASQALTAVVYGAAGLNDPEFDSALTWMYENKLTSYNTSDAYRPFDTLTREQAAKFYVGFAQSLWLKADETKDCTFSDTAEMDSTLSWAVVESCKLGLFKGSNGKFMPTAAMTKAAALTVLVRAMAWAQDENVDPWWSNYFAKAQELGLTKETDVHAIDREVTRYEISLMLYRASGEKTSGNSSSDLSDLLSGLLGDDTSSSSTSSETSSEASTSTGSTVEEKVVEVRKSDVSWDLMEVTLNPDTPTYARLPKGADGVNVATFDLAAWDNDVTINSIVLKRVWDGAANGVTAIALYDDYGRISKSKTFNSSDDTSSVFFTPALVVKAGEIKKLSIYGTIGTTAWSQFALQLVSVETETKVSSDLPLTANLMEVGTTTASNLQIDADGSISNPKLGETTKVVAKFKLKNNTTNSEDITVNSITLKEDGSSDEQSDLRNLILKCGGTEIAKVSGMTSKYLTFEPKDGILVKEAKSLSCEITADIVGGASKTVSFILERDIDVVASGSKYKGINVSDYSAAAIADKNVSGGTGITIQAWELTIVTEEPSATEFRKNKKDIVLWKLKITSQAWKAIELQKVQVNLVAQTANSISTYMENVELYDETASVVYDLSSGCIVSGNDYLCSDTSLNIAIPETGTKIFQIRADSKNVAVGGYKFNVQLQAYNSTTNPKGYYFVSTQDDKQVTDVTPSSVSFKNMEGKSSTAEVTVLPMSTTKNAVIGAKDVEVVEFEVAADNSSALTMDRVVIAWAVVDNGTAGSASLDNTRISALYLYKAGDTSPLKRVSGSNIASNKATFDGFTVSIAKNAKQKFIVKADIVDDANQAADTAQFYVAWYRLNDEDNDDVYLANDTDSDNDLSDEATYATAYKSSRITTIQSTGSLKLDVDTTDTAVDKAKNVLGNTTSDFVASYETTATNEDVKIKDLQIVADESGASAWDFLASVSEVIIYKNDKTTEIDRESVSSSTVTFTNINYVVAQWSENLYVKVKTRKIGKDEAWRQTWNLKLTMKVTNAEGASSGKVISSIDHDSNVALVQAVTASSNGFAVVPVRISALSFVDSYAGTSRANKLTAWTNVLWIIAITTDDTTNTKTADGSALKTKLVSLTVNLEDNTANGADLANLTLTRINWNDTDGESAAVALGNATFTMTNLTSEDNMISKGTTVYYKVEWSVTLDTNSGNESARINLTNLNTGSFVYTNDSDTTNASTITALNLGSTRIDGTSISD